VTKSTPPPTQTRADRQRERTRRKLVDTARALIAERGVAGLRIHEITERADVALGSFYNHFATKEALVEAVVGESLSELAAATVPTGDADIDPAEVVAGAVLRFMRLPALAPDFARLVVNLHHADVLFATAVYPYARLAVERGVDTGRFVVSDIEVTVTAAVGGALALIRESLEGRHQPATHVLASMGVTGADAAKVLKSAMAREQAVEKARQKVG
jgi:AcrR family transcriptional regulator